MAYTDLFPKISLTGAFGFESDDLGNLLKSPYWLPAVDLLQPLFAMGRNKAKLKVAKAQYEQELYSYEKTVIEAFKEVNDAIVSVRKAKEVRLSQAKLEVAARKYLELAQLQYINGVTNYMDVLDAQRELLNAQIGLNSAVCNELSIGRWAEDIKNEELRIIFCVFEGTQMTQDTTDSHRFRRIEK